MTNGTWVDLIDSYKAADQYVAEQSPRDLTMTEHTPRLHAQLTNAFVAGARWHYGQPAGLEESQIAARALLDVALELRDEHGDLAEVLTNRAGAMIRGIV